MALLLAGCAALGALLGMTPSRVRTGWLGCAAILAAWLVFQPGICATAMAASISYGDPELLDGITTCRFLYGAAVPELTALDDDETAQPLQLVAAVLAVTLLLVVRRSRRRADGPG